MLNPRFLSFSIYKTHFPQKWFKMKTYFISEVYLLLNLGFLGFCCTEAPFPQKRIWNQETFNLTNMSFTKSKFLNFFKYKRYFSTKRDLKWRNVWFNSVLLLFCKHLPTFSFKNILKSNCKNNNYYKKHTFSDWIVDF